MHRRSLISTLHFPEAPPSGAEWLPIWTNPLRGGLLWGGTRLLWTLPRTRSRLLRFQLQLTPTSGSEMRRWENSVFTRPRTLRWSVDAFLQLLRVSHVHKMSLVTADVTAFTAKFDTTGFGGWPVPTRRQQPRAAGIDPLSDTLGPVASLTPVWKVM